MRESSLACGVPAPCQSPSFRLAPSCYSPSARASPASCWGSVALGETAAETAPAARSKGLPGAPAAVAAPDRWEASPRPCSPPTSEAVRRRPCTADRRKPDPRPQSHGPSLEAGALSAAGPGNVSIAPPGWAAPEAKTAEHPRLASQQLVASGVPSACRHLEGTAPAWRRLAAPAEAP